ncbi:MAG: guanylate kinase [Bacteroidetes bacterium HGW-Bacteroidetes-10]|nr:MAG: guanylate kinase [Bacteroidetes bacterium HGW-Bacteroidetes-10]
MNKDRNVLIFSAPSGAGKSTIVQHLLTRYDYLEFSISATSREPRGEEQNGREYFFLSKEEFESRIAAGEFVEHEEVYKGFYYGTLKSEVERIWAKGHVTLFDIDVVGGLNLKKLYGDKALAIFISPPSIETLRERLVNRGTDSPEAIEKRVAKAALEMTYADGFDMIITNDKLESSLHEAERAVETYFKR